MGYIIFDLEFNQAFNEDDRKEISKCPFEIIQIGALKLDDNLAFLSSFNALVKPKIYKAMHPYVSEITKISNDDLSSAKTFDIIFEEFVNFIGEKDNMFCVWGMVDMKELFRNISYHELNMNAIPKMYINIQQYASKFLKSPKGKNIGLRNAVELFNVPLNKDFHDAFNDAYYTAEIFKKLQSVEFEPQTYDPNEIKKHSRMRLRESRKKIDIYGLLRQFEKMYKRKLSNDEKSMIILSYKMGLTNQFQIEYSKKNNNKH